MSSSITARRPNYWVIITSLPVVVRALPRCPRKMWCDVVQGARPGDDVRGNYSRSAQGSWDSCQESFDGAGKFPAIFAAANQVHRLERESQEREIDGRL